MAATERKATANRAARRKAEDIQLAGIRAEKNEIGLKMDAIKEKYDEKQVVRLLCVGEMGRFGWSDGRLGILCLEMVIGHTVLVGWAI